MAILTVLGVLLSLTLFQNALLVSAQDPDSSDSWNSATSEYHNSNSRMLSQYGSVDLFDYDSRMRKESDSAVTLRLYGNTIMGYYYVTLFFGSPLQRQNLIVDTGSTITTVPCTECGSECGKRHLNKPFDKAQSHTHQNFKCSERFSNYMCHDCENKCPFNIGYTEGSSYQGHFTKDYVVFGDEIEDYYVKKGFMNATQPEGPASSHFRPGESRDGLVRRNTGEDAEATAIQDIVDRRKVYMPFGCTVKETKLFYYQEADGILGLGVYTNSMKLPPNVVDVFGMSKDGAFNAFSICLASEGGLFTIGGYNKTHHDKSDTIKYVPFYAESGQYRVHMNRIEFEGQDLNLDEKALNHGQGAFFDSGTTLAYAPLGTVQAIKDALGHHCSLNNNNCGGNRRRGTCWLYNPDNNPTVEDFYASFGTFSIYFGEDGTQRYEWKPQDYLYQENSGSRWFCLGVEVFEDRTILGGTFMKNHDIIFDKREKRIGFVRANCTIDIPDWIGTAKLDESKATSDNLLALCIIFCVALIIYTLIRTNRKWTGSNKSFFPLSWTETLGFGRVSSPKGRSKLVSPE